MAKAKAAKRGKAAEAEEETGGKKKAKGPPALADVLAKIRKEEPTIVRFEGDPTGGTLYPTRFLGFNALLGGGVRGGSIIEFFGFEDAAKTSFTLAVAADVQRQSPPGHDLVVMLNFELPEDYKWWRKLGINTDPAKFVQLRPTSLEQGIGRLVELLDTKTVCCVVIDSVYAAAALARKQMLVKWASVDPKKAKGAAMGVEAVRWGEAWTSLKAMFTEGDVVCLAVNQMREKIEQGGPPRKGWMGKPVTTPRGHALKFYAWVRVRMEGFGFNPEVRKDDGKRVRLRIVKNKTSADAKGMVEYDIVRGTGWDMVSDLVEMSLQAGAIKAGGAGVFSIGNVKIRGREKLQAVIAGRPTVQTALRARVEKYLAERTAAAAEGGNAGNLTTGRPASNEDDEHEGDDDSDDAPDGDEG